jgi:hypothetical protein
MSLVLALDHSDIKIFPYRLDDTTPGDQSIPRVIVHNQIEEAIAVSLLLVLVAAKIGQWKLEDAYNKTIQMLSRQHPQAGSQQNDFRSEDTEITAIGTALGSSHTRPTDNTNDVATLDVLVLLLEGNIALGVLELAHDLYGHALGLADVEAESVRRNSDGHDAETHLDLGLVQLISTLKVLVVQKEVRQTGVSIKLVGVWVGRLGGAEGVDLLAPDLEVLVGRADLVSSVVSRVQSIHTAQLQPP